MAKLRMSLQFDRERIRQILHECVRASGLDNAYVELICTRGLYDADDHGAELGANLNLRVEERALPYDELMGANELFVTSTAGGVMPVA